jgi:hypothetical protein
MGAASDYNSYKEPIMISDFPLGIWELVQNSTSFAICLSDVARSEK